ncbi:MAG: UvrD-helicase domain-containing protein [Prevotella sp.]|nr:UvrD-helicase domain-containing protein [Prevotella sp.]
MNDNILTQLNTPQREAVEYCDGPALVIAGAGSGKTRVLTYKIAWLLMQGMKPWNILALTFTNKAAREMKERVAAFVGEEVAMRLRMGTFHSVFARILRVEGHLLGYNGQFTIYDETDSRSVLKSIIKEMKLDDNIYKPAAVHAVISMAKNHIITAERYMEDYEAQQRDKERKMPAIADIYKTYADRCRQANAMDFDDLLLMTYKLFDEHEEVRAKYEQMFHYVLVDEYQDTNSVQKEILWQLTRNHQKICVVGDDAQSIYAFRGANIDNILGFKSLYNDVREFKLEQNYRSTQRIVKAANSLIKKNKWQIEKDVFSENEKGDLLQLKEAFNDKEEAIIVTNDIERIRRNEHCSYSDFAVLYRTNAQSRSFEEVMRQKNIPYRIYGGMSFYQRKEIKDVIAYFRLTINPDDEEAFKRIINYPSRGIGNTTLDKIALAATSHQVSFWQVLDNPPQYGMQANRGTLAKLQAFKIMMEDFRSRLQALDAYELGTAIIQESGILQELSEDDTDEAKARRENLDEFMAGLKGFVEERQQTGDSEDTRLERFVQEVSLLTDIEDNEGDAEGPKVSLMTIHSAKGLEYDTVFVVGLEENILPSQQSAGNSRQIEEERRLLYVAITRARKHCILSYAKQRFRYGRMEIGTPSRFLRDIDTSLMKKPDALGAFPASGYAPWRGGQNSRPVASQFKADPKPRVVTHREEPAQSPFSQSFLVFLAEKNPRLRKLSEVTKQPSPASAPATPTGKTPLNEGDVIEHDRFGIGEVIKVEGTGENTKATVRFKQVGEKQLLLKFAKYKVVKFYK